LLAQNKYGHVQKRTGPNKRSHPYTNALVAYRSPSQRQESQENDIHALLHGIITDNIFILETKL
jgi:hypothetical protein